MRNADFGEHRIVMQDAGPCECGDQDCTTRKFELAVVLVGGVGKLDAEAITYISERTASISNLLRATNAHVVEWITALERLSDAISEGLNKRADNVREAASAN